MKKRTFPHTPYREKAKRKEPSPGFFKKPLSPRARTCETAAERYSLAGAAARELARILGEGRDPVGNHRLWAFYCYHHDPGIILDRAYELASMQRQGEIKNALTAFQRWLSDTYPKGDAQ